MKRLQRFLRWLLRKRIRDSGLLFSRGNIRIDREFEFMDGEACAYIEVWFDPEKKFGLWLPGDDYVNVYAFITPFTSEVRVVYIIQYADGSNDDERTFRGLTQDEKCLILEMVNEVSLAETGMTIDENWRDLQDELQAEGGVMV